MAFNSKPDSCPWRGRVTKSLFYFFFEVETFWNILKLIVCEAFNWTCIRGTAIDRPPERPMERPVERPHSGRRRAITWHTLMVALVPACVSCFSGVECLMLEGVVRCLLSALILREHYVFHKIAIKLLLLIMLALICLSAATFFIGFVSYMFFLYRFVIFWEGMVLMDQPGKAKSHYLVNQVYLLLYIYICALPLD